MTNEEILEQLNERYSQLLSIRAAMSGILPAVLDYVAGLPGFKEAYPDLSESYESAKSDLDDADEAMAEIKANWVARALGNEWCEPGEELAYNDEVYEVIQGHRAQFGWEPDVTPSLFKHKPNPGDEWPEFVHPTGAHDCYNAGDKVTFEGQHYICKMNNCAYSPAEYPAGWELVS